MAARNVVTVEFVARGDLLDRIDAAARALGSFGRSADRAARDADDFGRRSETAGRRAASGFDRAGRAAAAVSGFIRTAASTAAGFIAGSVILGGFSRLASVADDFAGKVVEGAKEGAAAQLFLRSAVRETGGSFADAEAKALAFARSVGTSTTEAERLFASATIGLQGTGLDSERFLRAAADLAAARGIGASELPTIITQIFNGADEGLGRLFAGKNPSTFFNEFARAAGRTADSLTDLERRQILANAVIQAGAGHAGLAASRLGTFGGILEQLSSLVTDLATKIGDALARNVGVTALLERTRAALLGLVSSDTNFDAFIQRVADGFVTAAERALDFAAMVGRGVNAAIGFVRRGAILAEQTFIGLYAVGRDLVDGIQSYLIDGLKFTTDITRQAVGALSALITSLTEGLVGRVRGALEGLGPTGRSLIPGAEAAYQNFKLIDDGLRLTERGAAAASSAFDATSLALDNWRQKVGASREETASLYKRIRDLSGGYGEIERATRDANAANDAFFAGLKQQLPQFAEFRAREGGGPEFVTRLIAEGDSLTSVRELVSSQVAATTNAAGKTTSAMQVLERKFATLGEQMTALGNLIAEKSFLATIDVVAGEGLTAEERTPAGGITP
jgi:hypothetical protein